MDHKIISPKNDIVFKALFGQNDDILMNFLSDTLSIPLSEINGLVVANPEIVPTTTDGKLTRLDIKLSTKTRNIDIEMQKAREDDYRERILYYWAGMYSEGIKKGEKYAELNQAVSLNILDFNMFDCKEYQSSFSIREDNRNELFTDKLALYFFELTKVGKSIDVNDRKKLWLQLINADNEKELEALDNTNIAIFHKSVNKIQQLGSDREIQEMIRIREEADLLERSRLYNAEKKGELRGELRGENKKMHKIVTNMLASGRTVKEVAEILCTTIEEVETAKNWQNS